MKGDEWDPYNERIVGRRRPDSVVVDWTNKDKELFVLEFQRTSNQSQIKDEITANDENLGARANSLVIGTAVITHIHGST